MWDARAGKAHSEERCQTWRGRRQAVETEMKWEAKCALDGPGSNGTGLEQSFCGKAPRWGSGEKRLVNASSVRRAFCWDALLASQKLYGKALYEDCVYFIY